MYFNVKFFFLFLEMYLKICVEYFKNSYELYILLHNVSACLKKQKVFFSLKRLREIIAQCLSWVGSTE